MSLHKTLRPDLYFTTTDPTVPLQEAMQRQATKDMMLFTDQENAAQTAFTLSGHAAVPLFQIKFILTLLNLKDTILLARFCQNIHPDNFQQASPAELASLGTIIQDYLKELPQQTQDECLSIPLSPPLPCHSSQETADWISIHPLYNPEKERERIETQASNFQDQNKRKNRITAQNDKNSSTPLKLNWRTRVKQIFWWILFAGAALWLIKGGKPDFTLIRWPH